MMHKKSITQGGMIYEDIMKWKNDAQGIRYEREGCCMRKAL